MEQERHEKLRKECVEYFKERSVYEKLFLKIRNKYESLGYFGGTVILGNLDRKEKEQLSGFLQKDYAENKTISISAKLLEQRLKTSRFSELSWEEIMEEYFGERLQIKKDVQEQEIKKQKNFFNQLLQKDFVPEGKIWLQDILENRSEGYLLLLRSYKEDSDGLVKMLTFVLDGISRLSVMKKEGKKELLAVFAAKVTGNPHTFDEGTTPEKLLFSYIQFQKTDFSEEQLTRVEYKNRLYYEAGLLKDDVSNEVLVYGIHGWKKEGIFHEGIEGFLKNREPVRLTLQTIGGLQKVSSQQQGKVYIVENPAVFSVLINKHPEWTVVCGNGQLRLATLILLDKFEKETLFFYSGDFDPEGLLIAQRLKIRYGGRLILWNYDLQWYEEYRSEVKLSASRIKKLEQLHLAELEELKLAICRCKKAAYQEAMLEKML